MAIYSLNVCTECILSHSLFSIFSLCSFVVFRCKSERKKKGTHLHFDVSFGDTHTATNDAADKRFPYYRFTKETVQPVVDEVFIGFGDGHDLTVEIMEIYARTSCAFGKWGNGVSILVFVEDQERSFKHYQLLEAAEKMQALFRDKVDGQLLARYSGRLEGIKANGMEVGWRKMYRSLNSMCCCVSETDANGLPLWYWVMVDVDKLDQFQAAKKKNASNLAKHGHILWSAVLFPPGVATQRKLLSEYTFYNTPKE